MVKFSTINAIPTMTSNTAPSGIASASSIYSASYDAWKAFDKVDNNTFGWLTVSGTLTGWIAYEFTSGISIGKYTVKSIANSSENRNPKDWTFEGSNDSNAWTILDKRINQTGWIDGQVREYEISNSLKYKKYRLNISANNGNASTTSVGELSMYEVVYEKKAIVKNPTTQNHYSLDNKTLIHLPSSSSKNMILHGIESGKEIKLDESFDKMKYVKDTSEVLGIGKKFTHVVDVSKTKVNKIIL